MNLDPFFPFIDNECGHISRIWLFSLYTIKGIVQPATYEHTYEAIHCLYPVSSNAKSVMILCKHLTKMFLINTSKLFPSCTIFPFLLKKNPERIILRQLFDPHNASVVFPFCCTVRNEMGAAISYLFYLSSFLKKSQYCFSINFRQLLQTNLILDMRFSESFCCQLLAYMHKCKPQMEHSNKWDQ